MSLSMSNRYKLTSGFSLNIDLEKNNKYLKYYSLFLRLTIFYEERNTDKGLDIHFYVLWISFIDANIKDFLRNENLNFEPV